MVSLPATVRRRKNRSSSISFQCRAVPRIVFDLHRREDRPDIVLRIRALRLPEGLGILEHLDLELPLLIQCEGVVSSPAWRKWVVSVKSHSRSSSGIPTMSTITCIGSR